MPFFYVLRMPLILGILTNFGVLYKRVIGNAENPNGMHEEAVNERCKCLKNYLRSFLTQNYVLLNLPDQQKEDDLLLIKSSDKKYATMLLQQI